MKSLILLLLCALCGPVEAEVANTTAPAVATTTLVSSLAKMGYPNGFTFDDTSMPDELTLKFYLPKGMPVIASTLRVIYRGSPDFSRDAMLAVSLNGLPPSLQTLAADSSMHEWQIEIPQEALGSGELKVSLHGYIPTNYSNYINGQAQSGAVHISGETALTSVVEGEPKTLQDAWLTLPERVVISLPKGPLDENLFRAALDWVTLLRRTHHSVRIATLPEVGNLVIAPLDKLNGIIAVSSGSGGGSSILWSESERNMGLARSNGGTFIVVVAPYPDVQHLAAHWHLITAPYVKAPEGKKAGDGGEYSMGLDAFGLSTAPAMLGHKLQWSATITPWNLPVGMRPDSANIHVAMPQTERRKLFRIYVYLNDMMVKSARLAGDGSDHLLTISFDDVKYSENYHLRVVLRDEGENDNIKPQKFYPISLSSQSNVTLRESKTIPIGFSEMPTALGHGFDVLMPTAALADSQHYLPTLGALLAGFVVPPADYKIAFFEGERAPVPQRRFIAMGEIPPADCGAVLHFDEGSVELIDFTGKILLSGNLLRRYSVVQMLRESNVAGLWLHPGETLGLPRIDSNRLGNDDVAIFDSDHLVLSIDSRQEDLARLNYPESPRWYERLHKQRFVWMMTAWLLLTIGIIYLYIKVKQHRRI